MRAKKIISGFIAAVTTVTMLATPAFAKGTVATQNPDFEIVNGVLESYGGTSANVIIPDGVKSISMFAFCGGNIKSITIPASVNDVIGEAFDSCVALVSINVNSANKSFSSAGGVLYNKDKTVLVAYPMNGGVKAFTVPDSVKSIEDYAFFDNHNLTDLTISSGVKSIGISAFDSCQKLKSVTVENGLTTISENAFGNCALLTDITLPDSVTTIADKAFSDCGKLKNININSGNKSYCSVDGVIYSNDKTVLVMYPNGKRGKAFTVPAGVKKIADSAFYECTGLLDITITPGVTEIGNGAFSGCSAITGITIPNTVVSIGDDAFAGCSGATSISIPVSVKSIGNGAFSYCAFTDVSIPSGVTLLGNDTFMSCTALKRVDLPYNLTKIENYAFGNCTALTDITIPDSVTSIDYDAFRGCSALRNITLPKSLTEIGEQAFDCCHALTNITIPSTATNIGNNVFTQCEGITISGAADSCAQIYADKYGIPFSATGEVIAHKYYDITANTSYNSSGKAKTFKAVVTRGDAPVLPDGRIMVVTTLSTGKQLTSYYKLTGDMTVQVVSVDADAQSSAIYVIDKEPDGTSAPEYYALSQYVEG